LKFSISSRQPEDYLNKADEMFVYWEDHSLIYELYHMAQKTIILRLPQTVEDELTTADWEKIKEYSSTLPFKLAIWNGAQAVTAKLNGIPFYFERPVNDWPTLNLWIKYYGVCEIIPGATLMHYMDALRMKHIPIRIIVNKHMMPNWDKTTPSSVVGAWVRPEDLWKAYEKYVSYVQFDIPWMPTRADLIREQALYRIYAEQKTWSGDVKMLIDNLNYEGVNRLIVEDFGTRRANCRQMCEVNGNCHFCYRALNLANPDLLRKVVRPQD